MGNSARKSSVLLKNGSGEYMPTRMAQIRTPGSTPGGRGAAGTLADGGRNADTAAVREGGWAASYKAKHILPILSSNPAPWCVPRGDENLHPHRNLHMDVSCGFIHNGQKLEQPRCPSEGRWTNKPWSFQMVEYHSALKWDGRSSQEKTWRNLKCTPLRERTNLVGPHALWFHLDDVIGKAKP